MYLKSFEEPMEIITLARVFRFRSGRQIIFPPSPFGPNRLRLLHWPSRSSPACQLLWKYSFMPMGPGPSLSLSLSLSCPCPFRVEEWSLGSLGSLGSLPSLPSLGSLSLGRGYFVFLLLLLILLLLRP